VDGLVNMLIEQRTLARKNKDFDQADKIRNRLDEFGITLEDTKDTTNWRRK
jgi:cysteinyl-tRNA synthetase